MEKFAISSVVALFVFLVASCWCVSATTLEELCKTTDYAEYCVKILSPTVTESTDFKSATWLKLVANRAAVRANFAMDFIFDHERYDLPGQENIGLIECVNHINMSFNENQNGEFDQASIDMLKAYDILLKSNTTASLTKEFHQYVNEAYMASAIARDIILPKTKN